MNELEFLMKRVFIFIWEVILFCLLLCGCSKKQPLQQLKVGFNPQFPPFSYRAKGQYTGFDIDLITEIARRNNWKITLVPIEWQLKFDDLNSGKVDCVISGFNILGRENLCEWTEPYADNTIVAVVKKDSKIRVLSDLSGKIAAVQKGTSIAQLLKTSEGMRDFSRTLRTIQEYPDHILAVKMVLAGVADTLFVDLDLAQNLVERYKENLIILIENVSTEKYGIGFRKGNTMLRDKVQTTLRSMIADGSAAELSRKYFFGRNILTIQQ